MKGLFVSSIAVILACRFAVADTEPLDVPIEARELSADATQPNNVVDRSAIRLAIPNVLRTTSDSQPVDELFQTKVAPDVELLTTKSSWVTRRDVSETSCCKSPS